MNKRIILILSTITIAIGSGYFISGKIIQKNYSAVVARLNSNDMLKVSLLSYDAGLFHSTAKLQVELPDETASKKFVLVEKITHGPLIAVSTPKGMRFKLIASKFKTYLDDPEQAELIKLTGNNNPFDITTVIDFGNKMTTWIKILGIDQTTPTQFNVAWSTIEGEISSDLHFANCNGYLNMPKLAINSSAWTFAVNELALKLDANSQADSNSHASLITAKSINFNRNDNAGIMLNNVEISANDNTVNQKLSTNLKILIEQSKILQQEFAQEQFTLAINNLDSSSFPSKELMSTLTASAMGSLMRDILDNPDLKMTVEIPKHFSEAFLAYVTYEIYINSTLGKIDQRPHEAILRDITATVNGLAKTIVKQKLFIDNGAFYALNFNQDVAQNS